VATLRNSLGLRAGLLSLIIFATLVGLWQLATQPAGGAGGAAVDPEYAKLVGAAAATGTKSAMPTPADIGATIWKHLADPFYVRGPNDKGIGIQLAYSIARVMAGYLLAALVAVPVGFLIGWYKSARTFLDPLINFFRALPPIALIPLVVVYFGIDEPAKVIILFYASFFAGVIVMYEGVAQISPIFIKVSRTLGASDGEIFLKVIIPLTMPHILTALRVALGVSWATLVASELVAAQQGLGALIQSAGSFFQIDIIYVGIVCIGTVALSMDLALRALTRRLIRWQDRVEAQ